MMPSLGREKRQTARVAPLPIGYRRQVKICRARRLFWLANLKRGGLWAMSLNHLRLGRWHLTPASARFREHRPVAILTGVVLGIVLSMGLTVRTLHAQAVWSTILGYVSDPSGAAVPGATVAAT